MANESTEQDIQDLLAFIRHNSDFGDWFEREVRNSPEELGEEQKQQMFRQIQDRINATKSPHKAKTIFYKWMRVAAVALLPLAIAYGGFHFFGADEKGMGEPIVVMAERGEKVNLTLPDSSRIWLNSDSKLTYYSNYNNTNRLIKLDGEAYFEVTHNPDKKFVVECNNMQVTVLGTAFNVKAYDEDSIISTVLVRGKVDVAILNKTLTMNPKERIVFDKSKSNIYSEVVEPNRFTEWRVNRLRFENETLLNIAVTISRIHNYDYLFEDETLKHIRFTGSVDNTNIESILDALMITSPITYTHTDNLIVFRKDNRKKKFYNN